MTGTVNRDFPLAPFSLTVDQLRANILSDFHAHVLCHYRSRAARVRRADYS